MNQQIKKALEEWLEKGIEHIDDDTLIEISIIVNKEVQHRELAL